MGAYLSTPLTDKISTDETNNYLACGASQMQGWRMSQEDAHICSLNFDANTSLFAVFDGHGGSEVAVYCSQKLPDFLKSIETYTKQEFDQALKDAFIGFDATLVEETVIEELRKLMPNEKDGESESEEDIEDDEEDLAELCQESEMPLQELLLKYKDKTALAAVKKSEVGASKPNSPFLRGRRNGEGSSSSSSSSSNSNSNSSSSSSSADGVGSSGVPPRKIDVDNTGEEAVSSSSASNVASPQKIANEASSSSNQAGETGTSSSSSSSSNGPSSSSPSQSASNSKIELDKNNCNSPDSSSANGKSAEVPASTTAESSEVKTVSKQVANGALSSENEISTNSAKPEGVSSSSAGASTAENGVASSNTGDKSRNRISSSKSLPTINDVDDDSSSDDDGSYNENKSTSDDDDEMASEGDDAEDDADEEEDDDDDTEDEEELYPEDDAFLTNMIEGPGSSSGCTAVVALLSGKDLYVANAGDSRCVVCRDGKALDMSLDHKPEDPEELDRIQKAGGRVTLDGRVNGGLNLSRAIGDHAYKTNKDLKAEKQMISALPDIKKTTITEQDEFMILACDGIWNSMTSDEVVSFVSKRLQSGQTKLSTICEELFANCLAPNTMGDGTGCDNMTAVIIQFKPALLQLESTLVADDVTSSSSKKRSASPSALAEAKQESHKRLKTDQVTDEEPST